MGRAAEPGLGPTIGNEHQAHEQRRTTGGHPQPPGAGAVRSVRCSIPALRAVLRPAPLRSVSASLMHRAVPAFVGPQCDTQPSRTWTEHHHPAAARSDHRTSSSDHRDGSTNEHAYDPRTMTSGSGPCSSWQSPSMVSPSAEYQTSTWPCSAHAMPEPPHFRQTRTGQIDGGSEQSPTTGTSHVGQVPSASTIRPTTACTGA